MKEIEIIHELPEIYDRLHRTFNVEWDKGIIIAYDGKIYCKLNPPSQKIYHEMVHLQEQKELGNEIWWEMYITNDKFRLDEELKAYRAEVKFIKKAIKNRNDAFEMIRNIAHDLSSEIYGNIISKDEALKLICQ